MKHSGNDKIIEVNNLIKSYKSLFHGEIRVLNNICFDVNYGSIFALLGPNGAGKSTLLKILLKLVRYQSGYISIFHQDINSIFVSKKIGYLPEYFFLPKSYTVYNVFKQFSLFYNIPGAYLEKRFIELVDRLNISDWLDKKVGILSKGMLQRLGFILSLINDPQLIILDEPLNGVDAHLTQDFKNIILDLKNDNKTIIISTHNLDFVESIADQISIIKNGSLISNKFVHQKIKQDTYELIFSNKIQNNILKSIIDEKRIIKITNNQIIIEVNDILSIHNLIIKLKEKGLKVISINIINNSLQKEYMNIIEQ
ncbi:MAG: ABC transporter ATP-binding protein [Melioribacteraceae bacterium]|nr:ABC transporter ATP-binding protein [Melioribacteraceae bacterium]